MGVSPWQLAVIALLLLVFFGRNRLGEIGRGLGRGVRELRKGSREFDGGARDDDDDDDDDQPEQPRARNAKAGVSARRHVMGKPRKPNADDE